MDEVRATLSSFAAERIFCETKAVTCLATIKFLSVGERESFKLHFLVTHEFKEKQTNVATYYPELLGNIYKMLIKVDFCCLYSSHATSIYYLADSCFNVFIFR